MSTENETLVRRWFEDVWNNGRTSAIDEMLSSNAVIRGLGADLIGPEGFKPFHAAYRQAFPDVTIRLEHLISEGDIVAVRWSGTGTHQGEGLGMAATGRRVQFSGMAFVRVEGAQIIEAWNNFDQLGMFQQLGVVNVPVAV